MTTIQVHAGGGAAGFARKLRQLRQRAPQAIPRALNRSASSAQVAMARVIAEDLGIGVTQAKRYVTVRPADERRHVAQLRASAARIPLIDFKATGPEPSRGRGRGVSARLGRTRGRFPDAFIATMRSGHRGVFKRIGAMERKSPGAWSKNLPIVQLHGPSIWRVFKKHAAVGIARAKEQLAKNLQHEFRFAMKQTG